MPLSKEASKAAIHFGQQLERAMANEKMTRTDLAAKSGMAYRYVCRVLDGKANLETATMLRLAHAVGCTINLRLISNEPEPTPNAKDVQSIG
jgi:transcriptional regulator with XRE-family HTH domain